MTNQEMEKMKMSSEVGESENLTFFKTYIPLVSRPQF